MSRRHAVAHRKEEETRQTIREWNARMTRLNSIELGEVDPNVGSGYSSYAGLYQYMSRNVMVGEDGEVRGRKSQPTNFERWASGKGEQRSLGSGREEFGHVSVSPAQCKDIRHHFEL